MVDPLFVCKVTKVLKGALKGRFRKLRSSEIDVQPPIPSPVSRKKEVIVLYVRALSSKMEYDSLQLAGRKVFIRRKHELKSTGF